MGKDGAEGRILRAAGVDTKADFTIPLPHMAHPHLPEGDAIFRAFQTVVILSAAEAVPHGLYGGIQLRGSPVRVAQIGDHAAKMLEGFVFVFNGCLQPVFGVQIHDDSALVKAVLALKFGFHREGEEALPGCHLQNRGIVIAEAVIGPLPQIRVGLCENFDSVRGDGIILRLPGPFQSGSIKKHLRFPPFARIPSGQRPAHHSRSAHPAPCRRLHPAARQ